VWLVLAGVKGVPVFNISSLRPGSDAKGLRILRSGVVVILFLSVAAAGQRFYSSAK
tara:strand:- start:316 stop:483 length:168 start_codon:yes stop_codon:yes gene_type:complete